MTDAETKFGPLESLVGRTFERDNQRYEIGARYEINGHQCTNVWSVDRVFGLMGVSSWSDAQLTAWIAEAEEVTQ